MSQKPGLDQLVKPAACAYCGNAAVNQIQGKTKRFPVCGPCVNELPGLRALLVATAACGICGRDHAPWCSVRLRPAGGGR